MKKSYRLIGFVLLGVAVSAVTGLFVKCAGGMQ